MGVVPISCRDLSSPQLEYQPVKGKRCSILAFQAEPAKFSYWLLYVVLGKLLNLAVPFFLSLK